MSFLLPHSDEAARYARWIDAAPALREPAMQKRRPLPEHALQVRWFAGELGRRFETLEGRTVEILDFGQWNRDDGPLFTDAVVAFDGEAPARGGIALHAVPHPVIDPETAPAPLLSLCTAERLATPPGPGAWVALGNAAYDFAPFPLPEASEDEPPLLEEVELPRFLAFLEAAAQYRLCQKWAALERANERFGPQEALYQALAETLGYRTNRLPFRLLSQRFPVKLLREQVARIEPILFAGSGFMSATDLAPMEGETRSYLRTLWEAWWPCRPDLERLILPPESWNRTGLRPVNHPQRRLAALAILAAHWPIIESLATACEPKTLYGFFQHLRHPYWDFHYTLTSRRSQRPMALLGTSRVTDMLANVLIPRKLREQPRLWEAYLALPASDPSRTVTTLGHRLLGSRFEELKLGLVHQQGLLQLAQQTDPEAWARLASDLRCWPLPER